MMWDSRYVVIYVSRAYAPHGGPGAVLARCDALVPRIVMMDLIAAGENGFSSVFRPVLSTRQIFLPGGRLFW